MYSRKPNANVYSHLLKRWYLTEKAARTAEKRSRNAAIRNTTLCYITQPTIMDWGCPTAEDQPPWSEEL